MISFAINIISILFVFFGIYLGYLISYRLYTFLKLTLQTPQQRIQKRLDAVISINEKLLDRYDLAVAQLIESYPAPEKKYSIDDLEKIGNFFYDIDELGIQYIYIKPKNDNQIFYDAICLGERCAVKNHVSLEEYVP